MGFLKGGGFNRRITYASNKAFQILCDIPLEGFNVLLVDPEFLLLLEDLFFCEAKAVFTLNCHHS
jgi:hypothetical protein